MILEKDLIEEENTILPITEISETGPFDEGDLVSMTWGSVKYIVVNSSEDFENSTKTDKKFKYIIKSKTTGVINDTGYGRRKTVWFKQDELKMIKKCDNTHDKIIIK